MNAAYEEEEDLAPVEAPFQEEQDRELTLNSTTILALFFGLVLVCGLCFGLGFTLGKRSGANAGEPSAPVAAVISQPSEYRAKPSASAQNASVIEPVSTDASTDVPSSGSGSAPASDAEDSSPASGTKTSAEQATLKPAADVAPDAQAAGRFMVQVAAVSNPADAEVLIGALTKRGYTVAARHEPTDALLHVQIGPLPTRADAVSMRQKLLSDGYNAILK